MKKALVVVCIVIAILIGLYVISRLLPASIIKSVVGSDSTISNAACLYPIRVSGNSMQDYFKEGELASFDKCFESTELIPGKIIIYRDRDNNRIGIIVDKADGSYRVKQSNREAIFTVLEQDILAIYNK